MKLKGVFLLTSLLAAGAVIISRVERPEPSVSADPRLNEPMAAPSIIRKARKIQITNGGKSVLLVWQADDRQWHVKEYYGLQVSQSRLSRFIAGLCDTRVERLVTTNPDRMARFGFKDTKIDFFDGSGQPIWSVTLGKEGESGGRYIRFGSESKAYFANLILWLDMEPNGWVDTMLLDVKPDEVAKVEIPVEAGYVTMFRKKGGSWTSEKTPLGQHVVGETMESLLIILGHLRFTDTNELNDPAVAEAKLDLRTYRMTTYSGVTITLSFGRKSGGGAKPTFVWISSSDERASVNGLMRERAFQVADFVLVSLPQESADLFDAAVAASKRRIFAMPPPIFHQ